MAERQSDLSISDRLRRAGYGHRPSSRYEGKREVYRIETGEMVGDMSAEEAVQFLSSFPEGNPEARHGEG